MHLGFDKDQKTKKVQTSNSVRQININLKLTCKVCLVYSNGANQNCPKLNESLEPSLF